MLKTKSQKIWRNNFTVANTHYQMGTPAGFDFIVRQPKIFDGILKEFVWVQEGNNNTASYVLVDELRRLVIKTLKVINKNPEKIDKIHQEADAKIKAYFDYTLIASKINFHKLNFSELIGVYQKLMHHQIEHHSWAISTTWFVDSDNEDLSKLLIKRAEELVASSHYQTPDVFSTLTTPLKPSLAIKEELEAWKVVELISKSKKTLNIFKTKNPTDIIAKLDTLNPELKKKILAHYKKWLWQPFTYSGPAYDLDYYLSLWSGWIKEGIDYKKKIKELSEYANHVKKEKQKIIKDLKINKADQKFFNIAADIIFLKAYRKDALFFGMYVLDKILREVAVRLGLSIDQVRMMAFWELPTALRQGHFPADILNDRRKFSVYYQKGKVGVIYSGVKAKKFLNNLNIEKIVIKRVSELSGTVACPGKARGRVKIVNIPEEMAKMNKGDVMVAHSTFPSLVPAMKKASAIITDDGGITCHAAIVAREMKTPCVVGTKIATKVLHDGDLVEVDASLGTIKIVKK